MTKDEYIKMAEATAEATHKRCVDKHTPELIRQTAVKLFGQALKGISAAAALDIGLTRGEQDEILSTCIILARAFSDTYGTKKGAAHAGY